MTLASNNDSVSKTIASVESSFDSMKFVSIEPFLMLKEQRALRFSISNSQTKKNTAPGDWFTSSDFTVGGFDWCIEYFPHGKSDGDGKSIALYLSKRNPSEDVVALFTLNLQYRSGNSATSSPLMCNFKNQTGGDCRRGWGRFTTRATLEKNCIQNDSIVIICELAIFEKPSTTHGEASTSLPIIVPPSEIHSLLATLLETKDMTDVVFLVEGEMIPAHRLVLAARSPVLKAKLYGPMLEGSLECIQIPEMKAPVFKTMLHYIYTDSLPENVTLRLERSDNCPDESSIAPEDLLGAAEEYGLDRLKLICEDTLCKSLSIETVAATLVLADQHGCNQLKTACLEYMLDPINYVKVTRTEGFFHLVRTRHELLSELDLHSTLERMTRVPSQ